MTQENKRNWLAAIGAFVERIRYPEPQTPAQIEARAKRGKLLETYMKHKSTTGPISP